MKIKRKALTVLCSFLAISMLIVQAHSFAAFSGLKSLGVGISQQQQTNWCWAAVSQGILAYYNKSVTQANFVTTVKGSAVNNPASDAEAKSGLRSYGLSSTQTTSALSYNSIITQIVDYERPIYAGWSWTSGGGHAVLIKGLQNSHLTDNTDWVFYLDPNDASLYKVSYSWMVGSSAVGHVWDGTLYNITN